MNDAQPIGERFVMKDHMIFDTHTDAFIGASDACYLLNEASQLEATALELDDARQEIQKWKDELRKSNLQAAESISSARLRASEAEQQLAAVCANDEPAIEWPFTEREAKKIADAHNAALDAVQSELDEANKDCKCANDHLDAERVKRIAQGDAYERLKRDHKKQIDKLLDICELLREQLAAAQAKIVNFLKMLDTDETKDEVKRALDQTDTTALDAAIAEATKPLVDALQDIASGVPDRKQMIQVADLALAKVKK